MRTELSAPNYLSSIRQRLGLTDSTLECAHIALLICYIRPVGQQNFSSTICKSSSSGSDLLWSAHRQNRPSKHKPNEQSTRSRKHCALAVVKQKQKIFSQPQSRSQGAGRPKFNQLEMVTTFKYRVWTYCSADMLYPASKIFFRQFAEIGRASCRERV